MTPSGRIEPMTMLEAHDRFFAPIALAPLADDLARRLARFSIGPLLEISAGAGILTQAIASVLSAGMTIIATDANAEIVAHAAAKPGMARVTWQQADPLALPFSDATFGVVACQFADTRLGRPVDVFRQTRRVMKKGGRFVFGVMGLLQDNLVAACLQAALDRLFPDDPPRFVADGLHGYTATDRIDDDLTEAGFTDANYTTAELPFAAASAEDIAIGYCLGTPLRIELEARTEGDSLSVVQAVTAALEARFGSGAIATMMRANVVSAAG